MALLTRTELLGTYRRLMRLSCRFTLYNYREYSKRRVRDGFRGNRHVTDAAALSRLHAEAASSVGLLRRQTQLSEMYRTDRLVLESVDR